MARAIGSTKCRGPECSRDVPVTETAGGSLSLKCGFCGFSAYAPPGTKSARAIRAGLEAFDDERPAEPAPAAAAKPAAAAAAVTTTAPPAPKKPAFAFSLAGL